MNNFYEINIFTIKNKEKEKEINDFLTNNFNYLASKIYWMNEMSNGTFNFHHETKKAIEHLINVLNQKVLRKGEIE